MALPRALLIDEGRVDVSELVATLDVAFALGVRWAVLSRRRLLDGGGGDLIDSCRARARETGSRLLLEQDYQHVLDLDLDGVLLSDPDPRTLRARDVLGPERVLAMRTSRSAPPDPSILDAVDVLVSTLPRASDQGGGPPRFLDVPGAEVSADLRALPDVWGAIIRLPGRPSTDVRDAVRRIEAVWGSL